MINYYAEFCINSHSHNFSALNANTKSSTEFLSVPPPLITEARTFKLGAIVMPTHAEKQNRRGACKGGQMFNSVTVGFVHFFCAIQSNKTNTHQTQDPFLPLCFFLSFGISPPLVSLSFG